MGTIYEITLVSKKEKNSCKRNRNVDFCVWRIIHTVEALVCVFLACMVKCSQK